ncbi:MAG: nucleoside-diphosphate-sugar epimerase [Gammaproteobacteria bacterium]|jgi:nucleoside-diphosphate-sugar epimerase
MRTALVLGITGGFGRTVANALVGNGWQIRALMRDPKKLPPEFSSIDVIHGDAKNFDDVHRAAAATDLLVYGVNPPKYRWRGVAFPLLENTARVAEKLGLTVVFPGNVYNLDPLASPDFSENSLRRAVTAKGEIREAMEQRLNHASGRGARVIVLRLGDFIGSDLGSAWLGQLINRTKTGYALSAPGPTDLIHTWAYLPDVGTTVAKLVDLRQQFEPYSEFHFHGHRLSFNDIASAIREASGLSVTIKAFPCWVLRIMLPLSGLFRSLLEMRYLWNCEINLNENKLREVLGGNVPHTPIREALLNSGMASGNADSLLETVTI